MERESSGTARGALDREGAQVRVNQLEAENARLQRTVVGLGALVAEACMQGYIQAATLKGDRQDGQG